VLVLVPRPAEEDDGADATRVAPPLCRKPGYDMTREEAEALMTVRRTEHPEDGWMARERDAAWEVVRLPGMGRGPVRPAVESKPKPPQADDPRPAMWRDVGGPYGL